MELDLIAFLKDGKYRLQLLKEVDTSPKLPSELARKFNLNRASISRILKALKDRELIKSTSENTRTIVYSISEKGKKALEDINDI